MRDTIDMAREAGFPMAWISDNDGGVIRWKDIKAFEALVRADEREACARIAEEPSAATYECTVACGGPAQTFQQRFPKHSHDIAKEIRARGNT
jgi:hypothetical protein